MDSRSIAQVVARLQSATPPNEAAVRSSLVLPILRGLGWDVDDYEIVAPEFNVEGKSVDLALCHPKNRPQVFIEIKQSTTFDQGVEQLLLRYAFAHGIRIAILTDGQRWAFYLPSGEGSFSDRRFYHLDLLQRSQAEIEQYLARYLERSRIESGEAIKAATGDCEAAAQQRKLARDIPRAWVAMLQDCDEYVSLQLSEKVQALTGIRPSIETIEEFIRSAARHTPTDAPPSSALATSITRTTPDTRPSHTAAPAEPVASSSLWFAIQGQRQTRKAAIAVVRDALVELEKRSPGFLQSFEPEAPHGRTRRWISRDRDSLYERADLCENHSEKLIEGWWMGTNYNNSEKRKILSRIQTVVGRLGIRFDYSIDEAAESGE